MDQRDAINIAEKYANAISLKYELIKVILFGSYARGNYHKDSDIDIAVVLKDFKNIIETQRELMRIRRSIDSRIEPHPFRERDFETTNPLVSEIIQYGQDINASMPK